ncbi:MAG TPA: phosphatase PAP2 family protein [Bryobacteraceae bacterium]|nr:phosphatase PAP2 family protein [Bryobacteraceae bacterium]
MKCQLLRHRGASMALLLIPFNTGWAQSASNQIEPTAGSWKTFILTSGRELRVPPPPNAAATAGEIEWVRSLDTERNATAQKHMRYWDVGPPSYRWAEHMIDRIGQGRSGTVNMFRMMTYVTVAMHDATIAAWDSKYTHNRKRPSEIDPSITTLIPNPRSPSYPSEYGATAGAAAAVLAYFFPTEEQSLTNLADEAARSRLYARVELPSDYEAGLALGRAVAAKVIARARTDGADTPVTLTVPTTPGSWVGTNPIGQNIPQWRAFFLARNDEFRPPPPPAFDSAEKLAELAVVRDHPRTLTDPVAFMTNWKALFVESPDGVRTTWQKLAGQKIFEHGLAGNPPRAARVYALTSLSQFDTQIASYDGKFTYWAPRPSHLDRSITMLIPLPNHPCYPSNGAAYSCAPAEVLAYLFADDADAIREKGLEQARARVWAGIHFPSCINAGRDMATKVAQKVIAWAETDGSK